jgi:hypothetical protein
MILNRRPGKIGANIPSRTEKHGDDNVPAFDVPLEAIMLTQSELNELMNEPLTSVAWFNDRKDGLAEPLFKNVKHFSITDKYEASSVTIGVGLKEQLFTLEDVKLVKLKLSPCVGGLTELKLTVQAKIDDTNTSLFEYLSKDCSVEIEFGAISDEEKAKSRQPELNLDAGDRKPPKRAGRPRKVTNAGDALN